VHAAHRDGQPHLLAGARVVGHGPGQRQGKQAHAARDQGRKRQPGSSFGPAVDEECDSDGESGHEPYPRQRRLPDTGRERGSQRVRRERRAHRAAGRVRILREERDGGAEREGTEAGPDDEARAARRAPGRQQQAEEDRSADRPGQTEVRQALPTVFTTGATSLGRRLTAATTGLGAPALNWTAPETTCESADTTRQETT
jgi:hypothetical protein